MHKNFKTITINKLWSEDKFINKINQILLFVKAKLNNKQYIKVIKDLIIVFNGKPQKHKAISKDRYYTYNKFGHFG